MRDEVEKRGGGGQRMGNIFVVTTRWRDNANPFPGRVTEVKRVKLSRSECAWREYVRRTLAERDAREWARWQSEESQFEALADRAMEGREGNGG